MLVIGETDQENQQLPTFAKYTLEFKNNLLKIRYLVHLNKTSGIYSLFCFVFFIQLFTLITILTLVVYITMYWTLHLPAFFKCFLQLVTFQDFETESFIQSVGISVLILPGDVSYQLILPCDVAYLFTKPSELF